MPLFLNNRAYLTGLLSNELFKIILMEVNLAYWNTVFESKKNTPFKMQIEKWLNNFKIIKGSS